MTETLELPDEIIRATTRSPQTLIIFSAPKVGKTSNVAQLENNLIIDLENGSGYVDALKIKVTNYKELHEICEKIKAKGRPYKYITVDTVTALEDMCLDLALKLYQNTAMGKMYTGDILGLANGGGYKYLRDAFQLMINKIRECADRVILLGHTKDKSIEKEGKEVVARELDLTGKLSSITCANSDAVGFMYREGNDCILTFETNNELICGARPYHLRNKKIVISTETDGVLTTFWNRIYID